MTIAVIAAGPGGALDAVAASLAPAHVERWSPLAAPAWLARLPGVVGRYARRRGGPHDVAATPLLAVEAGLRAWAGSQTDRRYRSNFALRAAIDAWAAREVRRRRPRVVIAPSLAARRTFAAAREIGAATVLVVDVPLLRALHRDLDRAAAVWPARAFLRRFRAPSWAIARQDAERVLADLVIVRGPYARTLCLADGVPAARLAVLPVAPHTLRPPPAPTGRIRLAGLAAARHGIDTALAVAHQLGVALVVRIGEGSEPADLAHRAGVIVEPARGPAAAMSAVDAIICPAICETYPGELRTIGIPVIASAMASPYGDDDGAHDPRGARGAMYPELAELAELAELPDPYDARGFAAAVAAARPATHPAASIAVLAARIAELRAT